MEFVCTDRYATVRAANVRATFEAFALVPSTGKRLLAKHQLNLDDLTPENVVLVQSWLDALKEIQETVGPDSVRRVGELIFQNAHFPPQFATVDDVLGSLDTIYYMNHRGDVGHYICAKEDDSLIIRCETPYPRYFEWGLVEGICRGHLSQGRKYVVSFTSGLPNAHRTCSITVSRRPSSRT